MNKTQAGPTAGPTFFGHPRGLATLFFTEMWERFTYYGMRAILVLFLVAAVSSGGFGMDDRTATAIYGLYTAAVYLAGLPGGWIADRLIGARAAIIAGGILISSGDAVLALSSGLHEFYVGLMLIVLGVGLLKPNVSAVVAELYPEGGARLDAGFSVFYMGINLGGMLGPLVTGKAQALFGPRAGFMVAAVFMALGVLQFRLTSGNLGDAGRLKREQRVAPGRGASWVRLGAAVAVAGALFAACISGLIRVNPVRLAQATTVVIVVMAVLYFAYYFLGAGLDAEERRRGVVLVVLFLASAMFWSGFEQAGSSLTLFAERYTVRSFEALRWVIPTGWFQSLNSAFIIAFAPLFAWAWVSLARRHLNPSAPAKFAFGMIFMGLGFLVMAVAAAVVATGSKVLPSWLLFTYLFLTFGELCLSPVGLSFYTKLAPKRFVGQMMGIWFLALSLGNLIAGQLAGSFDPAHVEAMPSQYLHIVYFAVGFGVLLLFISRPVKKLMVNVE